MSLYIYVKDDELRAKTVEHIAKRRVTDSGCDILGPAWYWDSDADITYACDMKLGIHCAAFTSDGKPAPYILLARSSTSQTPIRLANQIGLADMGYRGELMARVDVIVPCQRYTFPAGTRLFQIVQHNWMPWEKIIIVDSLSELPAPNDDRGEGGFGSTGR